MRVEEESGLTLIELLVTTVLLATIVIIVAPFFRATFQAWQIGDRRAEIMQGARIGLERISQKIRGASQFISVTLPSDINGEIVILNADGSTDTFSRNAAKSTLDWDNESLVDSVSSLKFTCYKKDGTTTTPDPGEIKSVAIELIVTDEKNQALPIRLYSRVFRSTDEIVVGMLAYAEGTVQTPYYRIWNGNTWSAPLNDTADVGGGPIQWVVLKACPARDEFILGTLGADGDVNIQIYDGTTKTWGNLKEVTFSISAANDAYRGFDIAYESSGGRAIVVCENNVADPIYYTWDGVWSDSKVLDLPTAGIPVWIKLYSNPDSTSNEIILTTLDVGLDVTAGIWNGNTWINTRSLETAAELYTAEDIAMAYERQSKRAMIAWSDGARTTGGPQYRFWTPGWSAEFDASGFATTGDEPKWLQLSADPSSNRIAMGALDASSDVNVNVWSGAVWGTNVEVDASVEAHTKRCFDVAFERSGTQAMAAWSKSATHNVKYRLWSSVSNWPAELNGPNVGNDIQVLSLYQDPFSDDIFMATLTDDYDLELTKWNGSGWDTTNKLSLNLPVLLQEPFMFAYKVFP